METIEFEFENATLSSQDSQPRETVIPKGNQTQVSAAVTKYYGLIAKTHDCQWFMAKIEDERYGPYGARPEHPVCQGE
jgi:hypothetical protein